MARGYRRKRWDRSWQIVYDVPRAPTAGGANCFETVHGNNQYVLTSGEATPRTPAG